MKSDYEKMRKRLRGFLIAAYLQAAVLFAAATVGLLSEQIGPTVFVIAAVTFLSILPVIHVVHVILARVYPLDEPAGWHPTSMEARGPRDGPESGGGSRSRGEVPPNHPST